MQKKDTIYHNNLNNNFTKQNNTNGTKKFNIPPLNNMQMYNNNPMMPPNFMFANNGFQNNNRNGQPFFKGNNYPTQNPYNNYLNQSLLLQRQPQGPQQPYNNGFGGFANFPWNNGGYNNNMFPPMGVPNYSMCSPAQQQLMMMGQQANMVGGYPQNYFNGGMQPYLTDVIYCGN